MQLTAATKHRTYATASDANDTLMIYDGPANKARGWKSSVLEGSQANPPFTGDQDHNLAPRVPLLGKYN